MPCANGRLFDLWSRWNLGLYAIVTTLLILNSLVSFNRAGREEEFGFDNVWACNAVLGFGMDIVPRIMQDGLPRLNLKRAFY